MAGSLINVSRSVVYNRMIFDFRDHVAESMSARCECGDCTTVSFVVRQCLCMMGGTYLGSAWSFEGTMLGEGEGAQLYIDKWAELYSEVLDGVLRAMVVGCEFHIIEINCLSQLVV